MRTRRLLMMHVHDSQIFLPADEHVHHPRRARPAQDRVGQRHAHDDDRRAQIRPSRRPRFWYVLARRCRMGSANFVHIGTIKQAQLAAIRHNREVVARYRARAKTPGACSSPCRPFSML